MSAGRRFALGTTIALLAATSAHAEMDHRDYQATEMTGPAAMRSELQRRIEAERIEAARRAAEAQAAAEAARHAHEAELAARPYPVRLAEARCATTCHGPERFADTRHGWLGWLLVILRMRILNGALIESGESTVLARHLADTQAPGPWAVALEYAMLPTLLAAPWLGWRGWRRWKKGKRVTVQVPPGKLP
jgi:hypothetical protein